MMLKLKEDNGLFLKFKNKIISFDSIHQNSTYAFVSHAHSDHVIKKKTDIPILSSKETVKLINSRTNKSPNKYIESLENAKLLNAGHVLGSKSLLLEVDEKKILYTGDFNTRDRLFLKGFKPVKADILIIETTFGKPNYVFPKFKEVSKEASDWVQDQLKKGKNVMVIGYALGKAQILCKLFEKLPYPIFVDSQIIKINSVYSDFGIELRGFPSIREAKEKGYLSTPSIMVVPPHMVKYYWTPETKTAFFTGWANTGYPNKKIMNYDKTFSMSDHADYKELIEVVKKTDPEIVYTMHGFNREFAKDLKDLGFNAKPLVNGQTKIEDF